jgi:hypothetical protein
MLNMERMKVVDAKEKRPRGPGLAMRLGRGEVLGGRAASRWAVFSPSELMV